ncbi:hypothetical protein L6452_37954 [Arctium lappa]|uniref:Uncharacterized protein n=1 Tax=Arctium lappa TaxID=4217 RepID=A0ACB8Y4W8_ARCLA|nr:hypothetical protein L6452_37954 [Arctium lappa]
MILCGRFWSCGLYGKCRRLLNAKKVFDEMLLWELRSKAQEDPSYKEIPVGVILDLGSWVGRTVHSCITMAVSDFYAVNSHYKTRIVLHDRDAHGEPMHALSAALDLLEKTKVQAIIGSDSTSEAKFLAVLGDEARIPIISLSPTPSSNNHPYFLQIAQDETIQFKGMMGEGYKWIITSKTMDFLNFMDGEVIESMQGAVGFKSYIPQSRDLHKFTSRWRKEYDGRNLLMNFKDINAYAIWAHDAVSALAMAVEKQVLKSNMTNLETTGSIHKFALLNQMLRISFQGKGEQRVGFWTTDAAFTKKIGKLNSFFDHGLEPIVWPGGRLFQVTYDTQTNSTIISGFCGDVFQAAFSTLSGDVAYPFIPLTNNDREGAINYNDLIDRVHAGEFDVGIGDITITANRSRYVDFTLPFTDIGLGILSRNADASMWIFMKPLSSDLWVVSGCFFILLGFVIWVFEHRTNEEFQGEKLQSNLSRFVVSVWMFVVLVLTSSYIATLSSLLTVEQIQLASRGNSIGYYPSSSPIYGFMVRNTDFDVTRMKPYSTAEEYADALSRGSKKGGVDAIVDEIPYIKEFLTQYPSGYSMVVSEAVTSGFGFAFPRGSLLAPEISSQIAKLREDGTLRILEDKCVGTENVSSMDNAAGLKD